MCRTEIGTRRRLMLLPDIIIEIQNFNIVNISFYPDIPNVVKFHLLSILSINVCKRIINKELLEEVKKIITLELKHLIVTGQLYYFGGRWIDNCTSLNYNPLNFKQDYGYGI